MNIFWYLVLGLITGVFSGLIGIGGAIIIIPTLVIVFGLSQHMAQGGLLAAWTYYKQGFVDLKIAAIVCIGFFIGGLIGAKFAVSIPEQILRKIFGGVLLLVSLKMILGK